MRILILGADQVLADTLTKCLSITGAIVNSSSASLSTNTEFDLLILDIDRPGVNGLEVLKKYRAQSKLPILALSSEGSLGACIRGLDSGADDYMAKPLDLLEFAARVRALSRRGKWLSNDNMVHGNFVYEPLGRAVTIDSLTVALSSKELALLEALIKRPGRLVSKEHLAHSLSGWGDELSMNAIEVYIHRVRNKIKKSSVSIATVRGLGYRLEKMPL